MLDVVLSFTHVCCSTHAAQAEVQKLMQDGAISLHTRNLKYGKVRHTGSHAWRGMCNDDDLALTHPSHEKMIVGGMSRSWRVACFGMPCATTRCVTRCIMYHAPCTHRAPCPYPCLMPLQLHNGQFLRVPSSLIKRCKQHFHTLPCGVDIIIGTNGYVWMTETQGYHEDETATPVKAAIINESKEETGEHVHVSG